LLNIIGGLLTPSGGSISIDGLPYTNLNKDLFRKRIGYITQEPVIFDDSIRNNIVMGDEANFDPIRLARTIQKAHLASFINNLPQKEETQLGNNGISLSGGQRQRISIARELYKNAELLILDEATSALDSETELEIQKSIDELKGQYTILIVAHRLSTIVQADRIIVLKEGSISQMGSFDELIQLGTDFKKMVEMQSL
jgi:ABC-type multidrug transport system fused ATPase/permease subunit